jgi:hypothetical protein
MGDRTEEILYRVILGIAILSVLNAYMGWLNV